MRHTPSPRRSAPTTALAAICALLLCVPLAACQTTTYRYKGISGSQRTEVTGKGVTIKKTTMPRNTGLHSSSTNRADRR